MSEQVEPDTWNPPHDTLKQSTDAKLQSLLKEYTSQFAQGRMSIGTTCLTEMTIDTRTSEPVSQKTVPNCHETIPMGKRQNRETTCSKGHMKKQIELLSAHHSHSKRRWRKKLSN